MAILLWVAAAVSLALWSVLAWVGHSLVPAAAGLIAAAPAWLGVDPATAALVTGVTAPLVPVAEGAIVLIWALGALVILAAPLLVRRVARRAREARDGAAGLALWWLERRRKGRPRVIEGVPRRVTDRRPGRAHW